MKSINLTPELYEYLLQINPPENPHLRDLRIKTDRLKYARLRSPTEQVQFIMFLLQFLRPKRVLEVGTFTGYSTLAMALSTPADTMITTCDINNIFPETGQEIWKNAGVNDRIQLMLGPAMETLTQLKMQDYDFDFIFIDADKENYWEYFSLSLELLSQNGLIMIDNVLWRGQVVDSNHNDMRTIAIRDFNQRLAHHPDIHYCFIPVGDGISLVSKKGAH